MEKNSTKGCLQGSCCGRGFWNLQYNPLLHLSYTNHTKVVAVADDLIIMIKAESIGGVENIANVEMNKITAWGKEKKIRFNEGKSKATLMTRRRKEQKYVDKDLNNKPIPQVHRLKYMGIIFYGKLTFNL